MSEKTIHLTPAELAEIVADAVARALAHRSVSVRYGERKTRHSPYPPARDWQELRRYVFSRDGYICTYCGSDGDGVSLHCDHVIPVSRGGSHHPDNLTTACKACNSSKRANPVAQWKGRKA